MLKCCVACGQRLLTGCTRVEGAGLTSCRRFFGRSGRRQRATGQTPFALVYGAEAVLPTELIYGSPRVLAYDELEKEQLRQDDATLFEEDRLRAAMRGARYQQALHRYHSRRVHARSFEEGDLVLRRVQSAKNSNKLTPKWEGPYRVIRVTRPAAVRLETKDAILVSNSWNIEHLRKFYP